MQFSNLAKKSAMTILLGLSVSQVSFAKPTKLSENWQYDVVKDTCKYTISHQTGGKTVSFKGDMSGSKNPKYCMDFVTSEAKVLSSNIAVIDAIGESGGVVTIVFFTNNKIFTKAIPYEGTEEVGLSYKIVGNQLKLSTPIWKKTVILQNNGKIVAK